MTPSGFIEVTCLSDGLKCLLRVDNIAALYDCGEERFSWGTKPSHTMIVYSSETVDVAESYEEVKDMMWKADL